jgi:hypothetical protein
MIDVNRSYPEIRPFTPKQFLPERKWAFVVDLLLSEFDAIESLGALDVRKRTVDFTPHDCELTPCVFGKIEVQLGFLEQQISQVEVPAR